VCLPLMGDRCVTVNLMHLRSESYRMTRIGQKGKFLE